MPKKTPYREFGDSLKGLIANKGWDQSDLGRAASKQLPTGETIARGLISSYCRGEAYPRDNYRLAIEKALGLPRTIDKVFAELGHVGRAAGRFWNEAVPSPPANHLLAGLHRPLTKSGKKPTAATAQDVRRPGGAGQPIFSWDLEPWREAGQRAIPDVSDRGCFVYSDRCSPEVTRI
jgi:hypothetical protein